MSIRLGLIGAGMIGRDHALRINNTLQGAKVTAINDINRDNAQQLANELGGAQLFDDPHQLIQSDDVDALIICSWGPTHEEYVLASIAAGKYVFCEKPLATTAQGCMNIVNAEMAVGKKLVQVGYMRRYDLGYRQLKEVVDAGTLGEVLMMHCAHRNPTVPEMYVTRMAIEDTLVHELDVLRWMVGDDYKTAQVVFPKKTRHAHSKVADPQIVLLETKGGIRIDVEIFVNCQYGYDIQCAVVGEEGVANLPEPQSVSVRKAHKFSSDVLADWKKRFVDAYDVELQDFINDMASGQLKGPTAWDGYAAAVAADACVKAQESGNIENIELPDCPVFYQQ